MKMKTLAKKALLVLTAVTLTFGCVLASSDKAQASSSPTLKKPKIVKFERTDVDKAKVTVKIPGKPVKIAKSATKAQAEKYTVLSPKAEVRLSSVKIYAKYGDKNASATVKKKGKNTVVFTIKNQDIETTSGSKKVYMSLRWAGNQGKNLKETGWSKVATLSSSSKKFKCVFFDICKQTEYTKVVNYFKCEYCGFKAGNTDENGKEWTELMALKLGISYSEYWNKIHDKTGCKYCGFGGKKLAEPKTVVRTRYRWVKK